MRIPRSYIENYSRALNLVSERARAQLESALARIDYSADEAAIRKAVLAVMQPACGASSTLAARLAADFYDGLRDRFGVDDGYRAQISSCRESEATEGAVRAFTQDLVDGKPPEQFIGKCIDRIDYETRRAANECVAYNARRDPKKPRWARVPTGAETCEHCIMLASRGFVYHSGETASHAHANCDCRVVPSWDKSPSAQGYDPDLYYDMWKHPERYGGELEIRKVIEGFDDLSPDYARQKRLASDMNALAKRMKRMGREEWSAAKAEWDSMKSEYDAVSADLSLAADIQSKAVRAAVGKIRTLGPEPGRHADDYFDMTAARAVRQTVEDALPYIPRDWIETLSQSGMKVKSMRRGSRSYFDEATNTLHLASDKDKLTAVHELMHAMDANSADFFADSEAYFLRRTAGKQDKRLRDITGNRGYHYAESAYDMDGECIHPYAYKIYGDAQSRQFAGFEVASMGVEYLYRKPWAFVNDPEMLTFVLNKIRSVS